MWRHSSSAYFLYRALLVLSRRQEAFRTKKALEDLLSVWVFVSTVTRDMMAQQNLFYEEMLSRQEAKFMPFKKMILESTTKRNDGIIKEEEEGISCLQFSRVHGDGEESYFNPNYCIFLLSAWILEAKTTKSHYWGNLESLNNKLNSALKATTAEMWHSRSKTNCGKSLEIKR